MAKYWPPVWLGAVLSSEMRHICERATNCPIGVLKCVQNRLCFSSFPPNLRIVLWKTCFPVFVLQICVAAIVWELWSKHFTSEHFAFSRCLFVSHPLCKGLQNLKKTGDHHSWESTSVPRRFYYVAPSSHREMNHTNASAADLPLFSVLVRLLCCSCCRVLTGWLTTAHVWPVTSAQNLRWLKVFYHPLNNRFHT